ncbi:hypothetical protein B0F90DRAFT_1781208 [Multifurca ochricompacta]|uniref:Uncharacterized protein n=1 Tax=Multifurca ochricompacta TaxID=376703 RepID=A0AAD4LU36_9AGAM|nr:hypothetical protein B0F90DRAFT_1781208 [Multifurca ochricompacta]
MCVSARQVLLIPLSVVPVGGLFVAAAFKALDTARYLHKPIPSPFSLVIRPFSSLFHRSRLLTSSWNTSGTTVFSSLLLRFDASLVGLVFSVSNQIGAVMWAHETALVCN